jgi:hypothetical protein
MKERQPLKILKADLQMEIICKIRHLAPQKLKKPIDKDTQPRAQKKQEGSPTCLKNSLS